MSIDHIFLARHSLANTSSIMSSFTTESSGQTSSTMRMGFQKSSIQVNVSNHFNSKVYTSSSPVTGDVTIRTRRDVRFDYIQIVLVGTTRTRVDGVNSAREVAHTFLKMVMPIPESSYPVPRVLHPGQTYTVPFEFVIPNHLTVSACNHKVRSPQLLDHHILLPPSMGSWEKDDMAPNMASVEYAIEARVFSQPDLHGKQVKVMEASQKIQVLPSSAEEPPLSLTKHDRLYTMTKSKTLRKGLLSGKQGRLTAEAVQPGAVTLGPDGHAMSGTTAQIKLTFDPASADIVPPKVTGVTGKVVAHTYYSSSGISDFPNVGDWTRDAVTQQRGAYSASASLPEVSVGHALWAQNLPSVVRRDSGYSTGSRSELDVEGANKSSRRESRSHGGGKTKTGVGAASPIFHTTTLRLPINLPLDKKTFIPTFHSCITSRFYTLQLSLSLASGSSVNTVSLSLPLQVAVAPDLEHGMGLPSFETAVQEAEADEHLRPRLIHIPEQEYTATSVLPGYGEWVATSS